MKILIVLILLTACSNRSNEKRLVSYEALLEELSNINQQVELLLENKNELESVIKERKLEIKSLESKILDFQDETDFLNSFSLNEMNQLFYGKWQATNRIFMTPMPTSDSLLTPKEMIEEMERHKEIFRGTTIRLTRNYIIIDESTRHENVKYSISIIPANDFYYILWGLTLANIGLTEISSNYFAYVQISPQGLLNGWGLSFYVKDWNTIIIDHGDFFIEFERISDESWGAGWARELPSSFVLPWEN